MGRTLAEDIADDLSRMAQDTDEFAIEMTYTAPSNTAVTVAGLWTPHDAGGLVANKEGRNVPRTGSVITSRQTTAGQSYTPTEDGRFTIDGLVWRVTRVTPTPGGYVMNVERNDRKQLMSSPAKT